MDQRSDSDTIWVVTPAPRTRASLSTEYYIASCKPYNTSPPPDICPACGRRRGMLRWEPPFNVECWAQNKGFSDLSLTSFCIIIANARSVKILQNTNISGFTVRGPVRIQRGRPRAVLDADHEERLVLEVQMCPIMVDERASEYIRACPIECFRCTYDGLCGYERVEFIRPFTHQPPDLFWALNGVAKLCCSDRFRALVKEYAWSGLQFEPSHEHAWRSPVAVESAMDWQGVLYMKDLDDPEAYLRKSRAWLAKHGRRTE